MSQNRTATFVLKGNAGESSTYFASIILIEPPLPQYPLVSLALCSGLGELGILGHNKSNLAALKRVEGTDEIDTELMGGYPSGMMTPFWPEGQQVSDGLLWLRAPLITVVCQPVYGEVRLNINKEYARLTKVLHPARTSVSLQTMLGPIGVMFSRLHPLTSQNGTPS